MPVKTNVKIVELPEFDANDLGIPFKVKLIDSVKQIVNPATGKIEKTIIPNVPGLIQCAAISRILEPRKLSGAELKFVRKAFKVPAKKLAETIGVSPEHLSRCEANDRVLSAGAEKCLRISVFLDNYRLSDSIEDKLQDKGEDVRKCLDIYKDVISKIEDILGDMRINAAYAVDDELIMAFKAEWRSPEDLFKNHIDANWSSDRLEGSIAA